MRCGHALLLPLAFRSIHHCSGKIAWEIKRENKFIPHRQNGLRLARMTSAVVSNRECEFRRTCEALPSAPRALFAESLISNIRLAGEPQHLGCWGMEEGGTPPHFFDKQNEQFLTRSRSANLFLERRPARHTQRGGGCVDSGKTSLCGR